MFAHSWTFLAKRKRGWKGSTARRGWNDRTDSDGDRVQIFSIVPCIDPGSIHFLNWRTWSHHALFLVSHQRFFLALATASSSPLEQKQLLCLRVLKCSLSYVNLLQQQLGKQSNGNSRIGLPPYSTSETVMRAQMVLADGQFIAKKRGRPTYELSSVNPI